VRGSGVCSYPQLSAFVCGGLKVLIQRNRVAAGALHALVLLSLFVFTAVAHL
jgi:hypothetical protein